jgi:hypothetical protein
MKLLQQVKIAALVRNILYRSSLIENKLCGCKLAVHIPGSKEPSFLKNFIVPQPVKQFLLVVKPGRHINVLTNACQLSLSLAE